MKENFKFEQAKVQPSLEELDGVSGREIEGIETREEKFLRLDENTDFKIVKDNPRVTSDKRLEDFVVFISPSSGTEVKKVEAPHWRAVNDQNVRSVLEVPLDDHEVFRDYFYSISTKGIGYMKPTAKGLDFEQYDSWTVKDKEGVNDRGYKVLGLISKEEAEGGALIEKSERLVKAGLRTELYWGFAELKRLPFKGEILTVDELRERGVISPRKTYYPYEVVRLFKVTNRIAEAAQSDERRLGLFEEAFSVFNREAKDKNLPLPELSLGNHSHEKIFFGEFFRRMGSNMALLLNIGHDHGYMHSANVTLAAEIVDVGTIDHWKEEEDQHALKTYEGVRRAHIKDMRDMCYGLRMLINAAKRADLDYGSRAELRKEFFEGFEEVFDDKLARKEKTSPTGARTWMQRIFDKVIVEGGNLPPLLHNEIEDWEI